MSLPFFITILIILLYIVIFMKKRLSFTSNSIQFMILSIISTNYFTIMTNKLEWMEASEDLTQFISLLINRECILPIAGVIIVNGFMNYEKKTNKWIFFLSLLFFISVLDVLHVHFHSLSYPEWSLLNTVIVNSMYLIFCIALGKWLYHLQKKEEARHESNL